VIRLWLTLLTLVLAPALAWAAPQPVLPAIGKPQKLSYSPLSITRADGKKLDFQVEVARTPEQQEIGMMWRTSVAPDKGMLFVFDAPRQANFWMENTLIPLDMLFIRKDGRVANIIENATPLTRSLRSSDGPVIAVLELAGGSAARLGLKAGDRVKHRDLRRR
jgi:uncharacterized protein